MEILFALNIFAAFALLFWPVWFARTQLKLPWLNPFSIAAIVGLPVPVMKLIGGPLILIEDGLFDYGYQFALLMGNLFSISQLMSSVLFLRVCIVLRIHRFLPFTRVLVRLGALRRGTLLFIAIYMLAFLLLASADFGVINWFANPREGYQLHRTGQGHWYALAVSAMSVAFVLATLWRPQPLWVMVNTFVCLLMGYLLGSKAILLSIFTSAAIFLWFMRWRYLPAMIFVGTPLVMALMAFNLYLAFAEAFDIQTILEYFDFYKNAADYYRGYLRGEISLFLGEVAISSLWAYVPRGLWPDKPVTYGVLLVNEIFYPGAAEMTNTPAFGGAVEQFADFGVLGVIVFGFFSSQSILTAILSYFIFLRPGVSLFDARLSSILLLIVQYSPAFGFFFPAGLYVLLLFTVVILLLAVGTSRRRSATRVSATISP